MTDRLTPERRSWNMSRIRSKNTKPEISVRSLLHRMGYRFSLRRKDLPGRPDIVLQKYKTVIFVHGCFWHRHKGCFRATIPKSNRKYWKLKLENNATRFDNNKSKLRILGWKCAIIWECETKDQSKLARKIKCILQNPRKR